MDGGRAHPALLAWAIAFAVLLALHGVLPQAHLAWGHAPDAACDGHAVASPVALHLAPGDPGHPACAICQDLAAAPALNLPGPAPAAPAATLPVHVVPPPGDSGVVPGMEIRWSLARGPPRA